jgi:hypothetical protein
MAKYVFLTLAVAAALVAPASANLISNGGFEEGATGNIGAGMPAWGVWGSSGWHHDDAGRVIGTKAIKFWWDDAGVFQDATVVAGQQYLFSVEAFNASADRLVGWNGVLKAEFYNSALGTDPAHKLSELVVDKYFSATDPVDQWVTVSGTVIPPPTADVARVILLIADWQPVQGGSLNFDEASVTLVPEPATAGLLGLMLVVGLRRR